MAILLEEEGLLRPGAASTRRTSTTSCCSRRAAGNLSARPDAGVHGELHRAPAASGRSRSTTRRSTTARCSAPSLTRNVVFSQHNLVTDRSFSEFHVIFCRNVLIYFDKTLQNRVHSLFYDCLVMFGILALGSKESLQVLAVRAVLREAESDARSSTGRSTDDRSPGVGYDIVVVGTSWGGLAALRDARRAACRATFRMAVVARAASPQGLRSPAARAAAGAHRRSCVCEVEDKMPIEHGHVYVAPPDYHMLDRAGTLLAQHGRAGALQPSVDRRHVRLGGRRVRTSRGRRRAHGRERRRRGRAAAHLRSRRAGDRAGSGRRAESPTMPAAAQDAVPRARVMTLPQIAEVSGRRCRRRIPSGWTHEHGAPRHAACPLR